MSKINNEALARLYTGYSSSALLRKGLLVLQVYIDDSQKVLGRKRLFMAGYINSIPAWDEFTYDWEACLAAKRRIEYFKSTEANGMRGQFKGWGKLDRDIKVQRLASVISRSNPWSFHVSIDLKSFKEAFHKKGVPWGFRQPYWLAFEAAIGKVPEIANYLDVDGPVDFIFDSQNQIHRSASALWECVKESQPDDVKSRLGEMPIFRDDKDVLPLQAADMLAWHVQREFRFGELNPKLTVSESIIQSGRHFTVDIDDERLREMGSGLQAIGEFANIDTKSEWRNVLDFIDQGE